MDCILHKLLDWTTFLKLKMKKNNKTLCKLNSVDGCSSCDNMQVLCRLMSSNWGSIVIRSAKPYFANPGATVLHLLH